MLFREKNSKEINIQENLRKKAINVSDLVSQNNGGKDISEQRDIKRAPRTKRQFYSNSTYEWVTAKSDTYLSSWGHADSRDTNYVSLMWHDCKLPVTPCNGLGQIFWKEKQILQLIFSKCAEFGTNRIKATNRTWHP